MRKGKKGRSLSPKQRLALTTALVGAAVAGYGRRSYAACANSGGSTYLCTGAAGANTTTQVINVGTDAAVSTAPGFGIDTTAGGDAFQITGNGALSFTDNNNSSILAGASGFRIYNQGGYLYPTPASITVNTSVGTQITAGANGIFAYGYSYTSTSITHRGSITATNNGIYARNNSVVGQGISITTTVGSSISGNTGIFTRSSGAATTITVNGDVTGSVNGVQAINDTAATNLAITTGSGTISGVQNAIYANNNGTGATNVTVGGNLSSTTGYSVYARNGATATNLSVTTNTGSNITGYQGIYAKNYGTGTINVTLGGAISTSSTALAVYGPYSTGVNVTVQAGSSLSSTAQSLFNVRNYGTGATNITVSGDMSASCTGCFAIRASSGTTDINITVQNGATVTGDPAISAQGFRSNITLDGRSGTVTIANNGTGGAYNPPRAIYMGYGNDTLNLLGPVVIHGGVYGQTGTDTLSFDNSTVTLDANRAFRNFETLSVTGPSTVTGDINSPGAAITLSSSASGALHLNGNLTATSLTIGNGATFAGNNTVNGNVVVNGGGDVAPGNSIGTINVVGNVTFNSGSNFDVEVAGATADLLNVTGNVNINSGAILNLTPLAPFTGVSTNIITATGTVTGTFGTINFNGVNASVLYNPTSVSLGSASGGTAVSVVSLNSSAFNAQMQAALGSSLVFDELMASKTTEGVFEQGNYYWMKALYRHTDRDAEDGYAGFSNNAYGVALGHQSELSPHWKIGVSLAELGHDLNGQSGSSDSNGNSTFGFLYGTYTHPIASAQWFATLGFTTGYHNNEGERLVSNSGVVAQAQSDYHDVDVGGLLQTGLRLPLNEHWDVTPKVGVSYLHTEADGFTETGGGAAGVSINDYDFDTVKVREGVALSSSHFMLTDTIKVRPNAELSFSQELATTDRSISGTFSNGTRFTTRLDNHDHNFTNIAIGADFDIAPGVTGFISYEKSMRTKEDRDDARIGVSVQF